MTSTSFFSPPSSSAPRLDYFSTSQPSTAPVSPANSSPSSSASSLSPESSALASSSMLVDEKPKSIGSAATTASPGSDGGGGGKERTDGVGADDDAGEAMVETEPGPGMESEGASAGDNDEAGAPESSNSRPPLAVEPDPARLAPAADDPNPNPALPSPPHVDIVSYPSADLLRLLASLLEQIAHANDALNQRTATSSASPSALGSESDLTRGTFDAAPLNSPVTPRFRRSRRSSDNDEGEGDEDARDLPVTPGVDLLNEVDALRPGVAGFMPSLGGAHNPVPLGRRRGSSFLTKVAPPLPSTSSSSLSTSSALPPPQIEPPVSSLLTASSLALSSPSATLCFHARNVPAISIEAYLLRILKYCPTTNEVFLSLLVYFDRMARVGLEAQRIGLTGGGTGGVGGGGGGTPRLFAIDSFNVHRLVIAGVTVASKFFSDVFYTNSRYAKVGGLPLTELNQLELQFLLLNDFRLVIPLDELQRYADQLILFWVGRNPVHPSSALSSSSAAGTPLPTPITIPERPRSVRSEPSSSGTSVASTVTPGTPRVGARGDGEDGEDGDGGYGDGDGEEGEGVRMDED